MIRQIIWRVDGTLTVATSGGRNWMCTGSYVVKPVRVLIGA